MDGELVLLSLLHFQKSLFIQSRHQPHVHFMLRVSLSQYPNHKVQKLLC